MRVIGPMGRPDIRGSIRNSSSSAREPRPVRVSAERVFELARHLTERDREIVGVLFEQQLLTTDQLTLLFFSSKRRAQDRLLFLYRHRVLDRFYPPARFGSGKPQAHWLLDEAGAILVAAQLGVERRKLGWQRRDDWGSHPQLSHRLETNRFVTDVIAATLPDESLGVSWWAGPAEAARRLNEDEDLSSPRPDGAFEFVCPAGSIECYLEWDRGTETRQRLHDKLRAYLQVHELWDYKQWAPLNLLFVVPGEGRLSTLEAAVSDLRENGKWKGYPFFTVWGLLAATAEDLARQGPLAPVWWPLTGDGRPRPIIELASCPGGGDPGAALGRRWRHDRADFWARLSPLAPKAPKPPQTGESGADLRLSGTDGLMPDLHDKEGS